MSRWLLLPLLTGCAVPLSTLHTAQTTPKGRVEFDYAEGIHIDSNFISGAVQTGQIVAMEAVEDDRVDGTVYLNDEQFRSLGRAVIATAMSSPIPVTELRGRVGVWDHVELGLQKSSAGWGAHTKVQILDQRDGAPLDLAVAFQAHRGSWGVGLPSYVSELIQLEEMTRTDFTVPVIVGRDYGPQGQLGFVYGGARAGLSLIQADMVETISDIAGADARLSGPMVSGALFGGGAVGWRYVYLIGELNVVGYNYHPAVLDKTIPFYGVDVYPVIGIRVRAWDPRKQGPAAAQEPVPAAIVPSPVSG